MTLRGSGAEYRRRKRSAWTQSAAEPWDPRAFQAAALPGREEVAAPRRIGSRFMVNRDDEVQQRLYQAYLRVASRVKVAVIALGGGQVSVTVHAHSEVDRSYPSAADEEATIPPGDSMTDADRIGKAGYFLQSDPFAKGATIAKNIYERFTGQKFPETLDLAFKFRNFQYTTPIAFIEEGDAESVIQASWDLTDAPQDLVALIIAEEVLHAVCECDEWLVHYDIDLHIVEGVRSHDPGRFQRFMDDVHAAEGQNIVPEEFYLESLGLLSLLPEPGDTFCGFTIENVIYRTNFSAVFFARQQNEKVALKFMRAPKASMRELAAVEKGAAPTSEDGFLWEYHYYTHAMKKTAHRESMPLMKDWPRLGGELPYVWFALQHVSGKVLYHWIQKPENRSTRRAMKVFKALMRAIRVREEDGWGIMDQHLLNSLVDESPAGEEFHVCQLDFGSIRPIGHELPGDGIDVTPVYFDPDFMEHPFSPLQHVFALGAFLFEMATGRNLYQATDEFKKINRGPFGLGVGELNMDLFRTALKGARTCDDLLRQVIASSALDPDTISDEDLAKILNDLLKIREVHLHVRGSFDAESLPPEIRGFLERAEREDASLNAYEIARLNRALLDAVYPREIRKRPTTEEILAPMLSDEWKPYLSAIAKAVATPAMISLAPAEAAPAAEGEASPSMNGSTSLKAERKPIMLRYANTAEFEAAVAEVEAKEAAKAPAKPAAPAPIGASTSVPTSAPAPAGKASAPAVFDNLVIRVLNHDDNDTRNVIFVRKTAGLGWKWTLVPQVDDVIGRLKNAWKTGLEFDVAVVDFHLTLPDKTPVWQEIRHKFPTLSLIVNTKNDMERQQALSLGARHAWDHLNEKPEVLFGMITSLVLRKSFARSWAYYAGSILNGLVGMRHSLDEAITPKQAGAVREEVVSLRTFLQALRGDAIEVTLEKDRPREIYFGPQGGIENKVRARWNNDEWRRLREEVVSSAALVKIEADLERIEAALGEVSPQQTENVQKLLEGLKPFVHSEEGVLAGAARAAGSLGPAGKRTTQNIPLKQKTQSIPLPALPPGGPAAKAPSGPTAPDGGNSQV